MFVRHTIRCASFLVAVVLAIAATAAVAAEPLASWNDGHAKARIVGFVQAVTQQGGKDDFPPADEGPKRGWTIVSMKSDGKRVYPW